MTQIARILAAALLPAAAVAAETETAGVVPPDEVEIAADGTVAAPLTSEPGDGYRGVKLYIDESRAMCTACHYNADVEGTGQSGNVGPVLSLIGDKNPVPRLRAILVDPRQVFGADTEMPAFYVPDEAGETLLTAQEIEDLVAYLNELHLATR